MHDLNVVLLAGGSSSRFAPLKEKNLYKFLGKTIVRRQIEKFLSMGVGTIIVITSDDNYNEIKSEADGFFSKIIVLKQTESGQSNAVKTALGHVTTGDILIVNMNDIFDDSLLIQFTNQYKILKSSGVNMLTGSKVDSYFPGGYLVIDDDGFVIDIQEKPGAGNEPSQYVRIVFDYFADIDTLRSELEDACSNKDDVYEVAIANMMHSGNKFKYLEYTGVWKTIKYPWHVLSVSKYYLSTIVGQSISEGTSIADTAVIKGPVIIQSGVRIYDGAIISGPVFIGKDSIIGNYSLIRNSIIGEKCVIGGSEVARSYFLGNVWLHKNYIGDSVIGDNVSFGSNALTANLRLDENNIAIKVKGKLINSDMNKVGSIVGSDVRIGVGTMLMPGTKIGNNSVIGPGVIVDKDVESNKFIRTSQSIVIKDNNIDIPTLNRSK